MKGKIKLIIKIIFNRGRYAFVIFDRERLPEEGDTIVVGELVAEFKKKRKCIKVC